MNPLPNQMGVNTNRTLVYAEMVSSINIFLYNMLGMIARYRQVVKGGYRFCILLAYVNVKINLNQRKKYRIIFYYFYRQPRHGINPATCMCLHQAMTWISNLLYRGHF